MCIRKSVKTSPKYEIVSKVAYLVGVPHSIFINEHEPPKLDIYDTLEQNPDAKAIRSLCILRNFIEKNYPSIKSLFENQFKNLNTLGNPETDQILAFLELYGILLVKPNHRLDDYIIDLNTLIVNNIHKIKDLFPLWINWEYIRELFIMPNGTSIEGIKAAAREYYSLKCFYPYQIYLGYLPHDSAQALENNGNILYCDQKFVQLLYKSHGQEFTDLSKVTELGDNERINIADFMLSNDNIVIAVDAENSDPWRCRAFLDYLASSNLAGNVCKVILFIDENCSPAWKYMSSEQIAIEKHTVNRVKSDKSLVDFEITINLTKAYYEQKHCSFVMLTSDSDYCSLVQNLPDCSFLFLLEEEKCSDVTLDTLNILGASYAFLDDICTSNTTDFVKNVTIGILKDDLLAILPNLKDVFNQVCQSSYTSLSSDEYSQIVSSVLKSVSVKFDSNGEPIIIEAC